MRRNRREFARDTLLAGAASIAGLQAAKADSTEQSGGWIDAHVHVWTPETERYPLDSRFDARDMRPESFTDVELFQHCRPLGVDRVVLIQMSFYGWDHRYLLDVMQRNPGVFSAVALIDFRTGGILSDAGSNSKRLSDSVAANARKLVSKGVRGFRVHSMGDAKEWIDSPGMHSLWRTAAEDRFAVCPLINPEDIEVVDQLCSRFPDTLVVIDHFARIGINGQIEKNRLDSLCRLARFPNVIVKTSAFYALGEKRPPYTDLLPMIQRVLDAFGPERLMWASDCPFQVQGEQTYKASLDLILQHADFLSQGDKEWLLRDTAQRVFFS
jgi:predicted TIM-barrel fold metal-dependent hydrolase